MRCARTLLAARLLLCFLAGWNAACGTRGGPPPPEVLVASDRLMHLNLAAGRVLRQRFLPAPGTDLALAPDARHLVLATGQGAAFLAVPSLEVGWNENLGIVDAVEFSPSGESAYLLLHPGDDPNEAEGDHRVREVAFPTGTPGREARLDARSYDLLVERSTGAIYVTDVVGRTVHRIEPSTFAVTDHAIGLGRSPDIEPLGAFLRLLFPGSRPGELVAVEDARASARLWRWEPAAGRLEPHPLDGVEPPVLGGGPLSEASPAGGGVWLHTRSHFLRLDADYHVTSRLALARTDSTAAYRFAAANGSTCVLLGPALLPRSHLRTRALWIDLERSAVAGVRLLDLRPGPLVLLPGAEAPVSAAASSTR